jgi:hypothetical protein
VIDLLLNSSDVPAQMKSAERKVQRLHTRIEKLDLELAIGNRFGLPDELVKSLFDDRAVTLVVNVYAVCDRRRMSIEDYAKANGPSPH